MWAVKVKVIDHELKFIFIMISSVIVKESQWEGLKTKKWQIKSLVTNVNVLKWPASENVESHWLHLFDFSPLWIVKCVLKLPTCKDLKSHWLHLFNFSPLCAFKCILILPA